MKLVGPVDYLVMGEICPKCGQQRTGYADRRGRQRGRLPEECRDQAACSGEIATALRNYDAFPAKEPAE